MLIRIKMYSTVQERIQGGGNRGLSPPLSNFRGGTVPPLRIVPRLSNSGGGQQKCPPPEWFRGGTEFAQGGDKQIFGRFAPVLSPPWANSVPPCPPLRSSGGGTKIFLGASRPFCPPPEQNPVSATDTTYNFLTSTNPASNTQLNPNNGTVVSYDYIYNFSFNIVVFWSVSEFAVHVWLFFAWSRYAITPPFITSFYFYCIHFVHWWQLIYLV